MSWLRVNLNDSLASLKGQLTSLATEVMSEDVVDEDGDYDTQVMVPRHRIKELESLCELQRQEMDEIKRGRAEVEERLHAADIHAAHQNNLLREKLSRQEEELRHLRQQSTEWGWDTGDSSQMVNHVSNHTPNDWADGLHGVNHHSPQQLPTNKGSAETDLLNQQLSRRVEELEKELASLRDNHQGEVAALLDQLRLAGRPPGEGEAGDADGNSNNVSQKHSSLQGSSRSARKSDEDGLSEPISTTGNNNVEWIEVRKVLEEEKAQLQVAVEGLQHQVHQLSSQAKEAAALESRVTALTAECESLRRENDQHTKNLVELDNQHQAVIEQILKTRSDLQAEVKGSKQTQENLSHEVEELQSKIQGKDEMINNMKSELERCRETERANVVSLEERLEKSVKQNDEMKTQLNALQNESSLSSNLEQEKKTLTDEKAKLEAEVLTLKEKLNGSISQKDQTRSLQTEVDHVNKQLQETLESKRQLTASVEKLQDDLGKLQTAYSGLQEEYQNSEQNRMLAESEVSNLNSRLHDNKEAMNATEKLALNHKIKEKEMAKTALEEQLKVIEAAKASAQKGLQEAQNELQELRSRIEIFESEVQAKNQEIAMSKDTVSEMEAKIKLTEKELTNLRKAKREEAEEVNKALVAHNQEVPSNLVAGVRRLVELLRDSAWQRDTLEHHVSTITQELREKNEQLQEAESTRVELERECEDLRDQLEEVQKGVRPQPEGSSRGLPTIEEEAEGGAEGEAEDEVEVVKREDFKKSECCAIGGSDIAALQAQVEALSEARRNLETEVSNVKEEREVLHVQLQEAEGKTGNLANLETEAGSLRAEKNELEARIATLTQQLDLETVTLRDERDTLEEHVTSLEEQLACVRAELSLLKHERESIGQQLLVQYQVLEEREATVRVLEGEVDGLKDTLRQKFAAAGSESDELTQHKVNEAKLEEELNKVKSQLIFKEDRVDELTQVLEQIGEVFKSEGNNITALHTHVQNTYTALQNSLQENDLRNKQLIKANAELQAELDLFKGKNAEVEADSAEKISGKEKELNSIRERLEKSETEVFQLRERLEESYIETNKNSDETSVLVNQLKLLESEKDNIACLLSQKSQEQMSAQEEISRLMAAVAQEKESVLHLQRENEEMRFNKDSQVSELSTMNREATENMSKVINQKDKEIEEQSTRITQLEDQIAQLQQNHPKLEALQEEKRAVEIENEKFVSVQNNLEGEKAKLLTEKAELENQIVTLNKEKQDLIVVKDSLAQQINGFKQERDQMIATITQKHQESVSYHAELQRLTQILTQTTQQSTEEKASLSSQLKLSETALTETRSHVASLREELDGLKKVQDDLQKSAADGIVQKTEATSLRKEVENLRAKHTSLEQERDQLRVANARFNSQYQDQSKELNSVREKEVRLAAECERLRQHLVSVEETYTAEALKAEERESTLRSTLNKMEEKLSNHSNLYNTASQRASVQVEVLQEQLREMTAKRDDAILRFQTAEESAEQHQQSLTTLQQVLQDFQKSQAREISEATERTRRQLEEEQDNSKALAVQVNNLKAQLAEVQSGLAAASRLGDQLDKKEQMIVALKAQVTSQEEVARKARDELVCLRTSSEGKVEKPLLRNLLVGYFATPADKRPEVLRVIAEVLDFSGEERSRTGIDTQGTSWLSSIANFLAPPASNVRVTSKVDVLDHTSLSQAFIRFLEDESSPRMQARLPAVQMAEQTTEKAEKKAQAKAQASSKINPFVSVGDATGTETKTESRNSSPLLAAASAPPTLPTFTPQGNTSSTSIVTPTPITPDSASSPLMSPVSTNKYLSTLLSADDSGRTEEGAGK